MAVAIPQRRSVLNGLIRAAHAATIYGEAGGMNHRIIVVFTSILAMTLACRAGRAEQAAATDWSNSPLAAKIRKLCPEINDSQLKFGWPLPQVASSIAMDRCFEISEGAPGKKLTAEDIRAWQLKAEQSGVQACWDRYLAIRDKHGALKRDAGAAARSMAAQREWERDPCYRRVGALRDAIVLSPYLKDLSRMYDDIMSGRQPNVRR
jgi:hypothetical protein